LEIYGFKYLIGGIGAMLTKSIVSMFNTKDYLEPKGLLFTGITTIFLMLCSSYMFGVLSQLSTVIEFITTTGFSITGSKYALADINPSYSTNIKCVNPHIQHSASAGNNPAGSGSGSGSGSSSGSGSGFGSGSGSAPASAPASNPASNPYRRVRVSDMLIQEQVQEQVQEQEVRV